MIDLSWKLKRELGRIGLQLRGLPGVVLGATRRRQHDLSAAGLVRQTEGALTLGPDVALLLVYQPAGLAGSTFRQLAHMVAKRLTPVVVSNAPLSASDRDRLRELSALVLERPNVGYDFGGYRDGILALRGTGQLLQNLVVLNDSVWFPLRADCTLLDAARAAPEDVFGVFYNTKNRRQSHWHLQSYFYRFGPRVLADSRFWALWQSMPLFNDKRIVIRKCELTLTGRLSGMGFSVGSAFDPADTVAAALRLSDAELRDIAVFHATASDRGKAVFGRSLRKGSDKADTTQILKAVDESRFRYYFNELHPLLFLRELQSPMLKKNHEPRFVAQRDAIRVGGYLEGLLPEVRAEIETWDDPRPPT